MKRQLALYIFAILFFGAGVSHFLIDHFFIERCQSGSHFAKQLFTFLEL